MAGQREGGQLARRTSRSKTVPQRRTATTLVYRQVGSTGWGQAPTRGDRQLGNTSSTTPHNTQWRAEGPTVTRHKTLAGPTKAVRGGWLPTRARDHLPSPATQAEPLECPVTAMKPSCRTPTDHPQHYQSQKHDEMVCHHELAILHPTGGRVFSVNARHGSAHLSKSVCPLLDPASPSAL